MAVRRILAGREIDKGLTVEAVVEELNVLINSHGLEFVIVAENSESIHVKVERTSDVDYTR